MQDTTAQSASPSPLNDVLSSTILGLTRSDNIVQLVVNKKKDNKDQRDSPRSRADLIELTERLAREAKDGSLKGLGGFADYGDGYDFCLKGSYLLNPGATALPFMRLQRLIMDQIEAED